MKPKKTGTNVKKEPKNDSAHNEKIEKMQEREYEQRQKREHDIEHERQQHEEIF